LGDPTGKFSEALDVSFDSVSIFGNQRSKRYAILVEDGKVKEAFIEPDNTGVKGICLVPALPEDANKK
jgi:2-Cys peroxiredoxin 5